MKSSAMKKSKSSTERSLSEHKAPASVNSSR